MKKLHLAAGAFVAAIIAGCSSQGAATVAPTTVTVVQPATTVTMPAATVTMTVTSSGSAGATSSATSMSSVQGMIGQPAAYQANLGSNANLGTVTLNEARWEAESRYTSPDGVVQEAGMASPENDSFLVLDVTVAATKGHVNAETFGWKAIGADGTEYGAATWSNFEPKLPGFRQLGVGESASGVVVLDVQRGPVTVTWSGEFNQQPVSWSVPA